MRGNGERNIADVMLVNRDGGRAWSSMAIPQVGGGVGEDAVAIDHDGNGLDDFLVLNGFNAAGPIQLIAFYERPPLDPRRGGQADRAARGSAGAPGDVTTPATMSTTPMSTAVGTPRIVQFQPSRNDLQDQAHAAVPDHPERGQVAVAQVRRRSDGTGSSAMKPPVMVSTDS